MKRKITVMAVVVLISLLIFSALRSTEVSQRLEGIIIPELQNATGMHFAAKKMFINAFPLFVEIRDLEAGDGKGSRLIFAEKVKGYVELLSLLRGEVKINRLVIRRPQISLSKQEAEQIAEHLKKYLSENKEYTIQMKADMIEFDDAGLLMRHGDLTASLQGVRAKLFLQDTPRVRILSSVLSITGKGLQDFQWNMATDLIIKDNQIDLIKLVLGHAESQANAKGALWLDRVIGDFVAEVMVTVESLKGFLGLKKSGKGTISAAGRILLNGKPTTLEKVALDLKVRGDMYLETLMELLKADEPLAGYMRFDGELKGALTDLEGSADAHLIDGNLFGVEVDDVACKVKYGDRIMRFIEGKAKLYKGSAMAEAAITLPVVTRYSLKVVADKVSSKGVFRLIGWDPHIGEGLVSGELSSSGERFNPTGSFTYAGIQRGKDALDRIRNIQGEFNIKEDVLEFPKLTLATDITRVSAKGTVDLSGQRLYLNGTTVTDNVLDLTSPYFNGVSGPFSGSFNVSGSFDDPLIDLQFTSNKTISFFTEALAIPSVVKNQTHTFNHAEGSLSYRKNLLTVRNLQALSKEGEFNVKGIIAFPNARSLLDLKNPHYDLSASIDLKSMKGLTDTFIGAPKADGSIMGNMNLKGLPDYIEASGEFRGNGLQLYGYSFDTVTGKINYKERAFHVPLLAFTTGKSLLNIKGRVSLDGAFSINGESKNIRAKDLLTPKIRERLKEGALDSLSLTDVKIKGAGTFQNPDIELTAAISETNSRKLSPYWGALKVVLGGKRLAISAYLLDEKATIQAECHLSGLFPWSAKIEMQHTRYDSLIAHLLKEVPDDLMVTLRGTIDAQGDKETARAVASLQSAHVQLYGNRFTNSKPLLVTLSDRKLSFDAVAFSSNTANFKLSGGLVVGERYNIMFDGLSELAPFKVFTKNIDYLRGRGSFKVSVSGDWRKPEINGGLDISDGTIGIRNMPHRISSISAFVFFDGDKVVIKRATGKVAGGEVGMEGTAFLQGFLIKRFFIESRLKGISGYLSNDFWINGDGTLYYWGNRDNQTITGEINVRRAKYSERIDWTKWILKAREPEKPKGDLTIFDQTSLNVKISAPNIIVDNNLARGAISADLLLKGSVSQPIPVGRVDSKEGIVYFRNNEFKVVRATIDFSSANQIKPHFDILGETKINAYSIKLGLNGYIEQFNLTLSSIPPLKESDIISLLAVGRIDTASKGLGGGIGTAEATSFLTGRIQDVMEDRIKTVTGLDKMQIDPYVSKKTGSITPRITVAKRLLGDKIYATYSTSVGTGGAEQIWKLEYQLSKTVSLIGVSDEQGGLGADIKFRFEFK